MHLNLGDIERSIAALQKIDPSDSAAYRKARSALMGIPTLPIFICDVPEGTALFRSRTHDSSDVFTRIPDIAEPPPDVISKYGRCNEPSQPRFYCSNSRPTSYIELVEEWRDSASTGEKIYVTVGRWTLQSAMPTVIVPMPGSNSESSAYDQKHSTHLDFFLDSIEAEVERAVEEFFTFVAKIFRQYGDPKTYAICTAYSNIALEQTEAAAIAYPSVPSGEQGFNYCIEPSFREIRNLRLTNVLQNEMTATIGSEGKYSFDETNRIIANRIDMSEGKIYW